MKQKAFLNLAAAICGLIVSTTLAFSQGTAFTYQGRLNSGGSPVTGLYDFTNALYNAPSGGAQAGPTLTNLAVPVTNGLFSVPLDFGAVFNGTAYWLQIGVRSNGAGGYTPLSPRQELTPTPYAIAAENLDGSLPAGQLTGTLGPGLFPLPLDLSGSTVPPLFEVDQNGSGIGISGVHTSAAGTNPGVEGSTASTDGGAVAVYGLVSSTSPGGFSAAVRGENKGTGLNGIGVYGSQAGSGWGGYFTNFSGAGLVADGGSGTGMYASGSTGDGVDGYSSTGIGVSGLHSETNGTAAGVQGETASTDRGAFGVYGVVSSTAPGSFSAAVRGENKGTGVLGIGVYGSQAGSGWGGYFTSISGIGLLADGGSGTGVFASGGTGVYTGGSNSALTIGYGAIHVSGAGIGTGTAAFIHRATAGNTAGDFTLIDNPQCNGDPNAILIITQNYNPGGGSGTYNTRHVGVYYTGSNWAIFNEDTTSMITNCAYNVLVIKN